jgi:hypothetical protein
MMKALPGDASKALVKDVRGVRAGFHTNQADSLKAGLGDLKGKALDRSKANIVKQKGLAKQVKSTGKM